MKIEELTKEQKDKFPEYVNKWLKIGLSTEPCDRKAAEKAVSECYAAAGLKPPKIFLWFDSPLECAYGQTFFAEFCKEMKSDVYQVWEWLCERLSELVCNQVRDDVVDKVGDKVREQVFKQGKCQVFEQVRDQLRDKDWNQAWVKHVFEQVGYKVWEQVMYKASRQVMDDVRNNVRAQVGDQVFKQGLHHVWKQADEQVKDQLFEQVFEQVYSQVVHNARDQTFSQVKLQACEEIKQIYFQVDEQVGGQVVELVKDQVGNQVWDPLEVQAWNQAWVKHVFEQVGYKVWDQVFKQGLHHVWKQVDEQVGELVVKLVKGQVVDQVRGQLFKQVEQQVLLQVFLDQAWDQLRDQLGAQVVEQVWSQFWDQSGGQVVELVKDQVGYQVKDQIRKLVNAQVRKDVREQPLNHFHNQIYGAHDANWLSFYDYFLNELKISECEKLKPLMDLALNCGWWAPYENVCFLQEKPCEFHIENKKLHKDGGPAILYRDGFSVWALNGIRVPQWVAETNPEKLDLEEIMRIDNVDVRAQALKRYTPERLITSGKGKVIEDRWDSDGYKLVDLSPVFTSISYAPHLLMKNPSVPGLIHCEGVSPECRTIQEAHNWRAGNIKEEFKPLILS